MADRKEKWSRTGRLSLLFVLGKDDIAPPLRGVKSKWYGSPKRIGHWEIKLSAIMLKYAAVFFT